MNTIDPRLRSFSSLTTALALAALLAGCGSRPVGGFGDGDVEPPRGGTTAPLDVCAPAPVVAVAVQLALPVGLATASCRLTGSESDSNGDGRSEHGTTYEVDGRVIRARQVTSGATGPGPVLAEYELDAAGRLTAYRDFRGRDEPTISYEWLHDDAGRLLVERTRSRSYSYYGGGAGSVRATVVRQVFDGPRLVSRSYEHDDVLQATFAFAYDDAGRMVRAERHDGAAPARPTARATWSYDAAGRPRSLVREEDGQVALVASWTFDARGVLRSRSMTLPRGATSTHELDVYDTWAAQNRSLVDAAAGNGPAQDGACRPLATELTFGYPQHEEDSYVLAFAGVGTEGDEMLAYVYSSAAAYSYYSYSPARAFGHDGAVAEYDAYPRYRYGRNGAPIRVDSEYDEAGRMTSERGEAATRWERQRVFAANGLAYDVLVRSSEADESETRALLFSRDARGRLTSRELVAASGIAATQRWSYDDATRTVVNTIHTEGSPQRPMQPVDARIVRAFDAQGRAVRDEVTLDRVATAEPRYGEPPAGSVFQRERSYDAAGRIAVETTTQYGSWQRTENRFDDAGRELFTQNTYGEVGAPSRATSSRTTTYNAAGLPTRREATSTGSYANRLAIETMRYACDGL